MAGTAQKVYDAIKNRDAQGRPSSSFLRAWTMRLKRPGPEKTQPDKSAVVLDVARAPGLPRRD
jgi:hypothetical protein